MSTYPCMHAHCMIHCLITHVCLRYKRSLSPAPHPYAKREHGACHCCALFGCGAPPVRARLHTTHPFVFMVHLLDLIFIALLDYGSLDWTSNFPLFFCAVKLGQATYLNCAPLPAPRVGHALGALHGLLAACDMIQAAWRSHAYACGTTPVQRSTFNISTQR